MLIHVDEKNNIDFVKSPRGDWSATLVNNNLEIEILFEETIFKKDSNNFHQIHWEGIQIAVPKMVAQIETFIAKSNAVLIVLYQQEFGNEIIENRGYFDLVSVEITSITTSSSIIDFEFELHFYLGSEVNSMYDTASYTASFYSIMPYVLTFSGVRRNRAK